MTRRNNEHDNTELGSRAGFRIRRENEKWNSKAEVTEKAKRAQRLGKLKDNKKKGK